MSLKTLKILASVFCALFFTTALVGWSPWRKEGKIAHDLTLSAISFDATTEVSWKQNDTAMKLSKEQGIWRINGYDTDDAHVKDFFTALQKMEILSLSSRNVAAESDFEVSENKGHRLTFTQGTKTQELILGKQSSGFDTFYIKQKGSNNVYLAKSNLKSLTEQALLWWRDTAITQLDVALLTTVEMSEKGATTIVTKTKEGTWELLRAGKKTDLEAAKAQTLTSTLSSLQASDFATPQEENLFKNAQQRIVVVVRDNAHAILAQLTMVPNKDTWIVQVQNKPALFKVPSSTVEKIVKL